MLERRQTSAHVTGFLRSSTIHRFCRIIIIICTIIIQSLIPPALVWRGIALKLCRFQMVEPVEKLRLVRPNPFHRERLSRKGKKTTRENKPIYKRMNHTAASSKQTFCRLNEKQRDYGSSNVLEKTFVVLLINAPAIYLLWWKVAKWYATCNDREPFTWPCWRI